MSKDFLRNPTEWILRKKKGRDIPQQLFFQFGLAVPLPIRFFVSHTALTDAFAIDEKVMSDDLEKKIWCVAPESTKASSMFSAKRQATLIRNCNFAMNPRKCGSSCWLWELELAPD